MPKTTSNENPDPLVIDTSHWKLKDPEWVAQRQARWEEMAFMFFAKSKKGLTALKQRSRTAIKPPPDHDTPQPAIRQRGFSPKCAVVGRDLQPEQAVTARFGGLQAALRPGWPGEVVDALTSGAMA